MKKINFDSIAAGLDTLTDLMQQNTEIAHDELVDADSIDFAAKNTFAADDTDETIRDLADSIELHGLLEPLVVVRDGGRYTLLAGERRYKAITQCLHWNTIPCRVFDGENLSSNRRQLMLHEANSQRDLSIGRQLQIFEEYNMLLEEMRESGEYTGAKLALIAKKMQISERQVRKYKRIAERLTRQEKEMLAAGELTVNEASQIAVARSRKAEPSSGFLERPETKAEPSSGFLERPEAKAEPSSGFLEKPETKAEPSSGFMEKPETKAEPSSGFLERPEAKAEPSSGFAEEAERFETPEARRVLLEEIVLSGNLWKPEKLYADYVQYMPTTKEAIAEILKPRYNFRSCSLILEGLKGHCTLNSTKAIIEIDLPRTTVVYSYTEVDAMIRELYRAHKLEAKK